MIDVLASELRKVRTARSTAIILGVVVLFVGLTALLAWYATATFDRLPPASRTHFALASLPDLMGWVDSLCLAILGVVTVTAEYATGMIRTTFTVTPRRWIVLVAKAAVVAAVAFVAAEAALVTISAVGRFVLGDRAIAGQVDPSREFGLLLALGLSATMFALLGLSLGALTRSALAAITILAALWYVVPMITYNLPDPWNNVLGSLLPGALAGALAGTGNIDSIYGNLLSPPAALVAMAAYAVVPLTAAAVLVTRRDV